MIDCQKFYEALVQKDVSFFTGVPDSLLKNLTHYISDHCDNHYICANEGSAIAMGIGHYLATGKTPCIYLQNSGLGHILNPLLSLADQEVYSIPMLILVGWRGEPGVEDEPQHFQQGNVTLPMLGATQLDYDVMPLTHDRAIGQLLVTLTNIKKDKRPHILVVRKGSFAKYNSEKIPSSSGSLNREECIEKVIHSFSESKFFASTGHISRELYDLRNRLNQTHNNDFLTVGGMGHVGQIALGYSLSSQRPCVCLDGDGSLLMHLGSLATSAHLAPKNLVHIVFDNNKHLSVGGQLTTGENLDFSQIAKSVGFKNVHSCSSMDELDQALVKAQTDGPHFIEIKTNDEFRPDLGRPKEKLIDRKRKFMEN